MRVSTIIPTYNRAADVRVAVQSALAQTLPAECQEILVVDDGSTDDTEAVIAALGPRVRYLRTPVNGGVSAARNLGIATAKGEAIAFLDSDDAWEPPKLERQVALLEAQPDIGLVLTSVQEVDARGRPGRYASRRASLPEDGRVLHHVLRNPAMCPSTAMVRRAVLDEVGPFDATLRTAEDLDLHLRIALHHGIAVIDEPLVRYRRDDYGLGGGLRSYHDYVFVMERFAARHRDALPAEQLREALFGVYVKNARGLLDHRSFAGVARMAWRGARQARQPAQFAALAGLALKYVRTAVARAVKGGHRAPG